MNELTQIIEQAKADIDAAGNVADLDQVRVTYLGKKGSLTERLKQLGKLSAEERPQAGQAINDAKKIVQEAINARRDILDNARINAKIAGERVDVTLPGRGEGSGGLHPITQTLERIESLFAQMGFEVAVVKDATAAAQIPEGDGYLAGLVNFRFMANAVWTTDEAVARISAAP